MDKPTDILERDIERAMDDLYDDVLNYSEASEIARAPELMRKHLERIIERLQVQLEDWKNLCEHENGNFNVGPYGTMVCVDCNRTV